MARRIDARLKIACTLTARTPLHVGGMGGDTDTDLALAVNGNGEFYVPGTSLAGALRGWFETRAVSDEAKAKFRRLLGYQKQQRGNQPGTDEHASFLLTEDARIESPAGKTLSAEIRDGIGIDRVTGAAAKQIKFDRAVLPRGTRIEFEMCVELGGNAEEQNDARRLTYTVLQALKAGEIRFGAAKSRGLGRVEVETLNLSEQGLLRKNGLLDTLRGKAKVIELGQSERQQLGFEARPRMTIDITWQPCGPLMVKSEHDGIAVDILPLTSAIGDHLSFVLPGSSIKGAFRSQAERIVRTLLKVDSPRIVERKQDFINQVEVKEPKPQAETTLASLIGWLFGSAGNTTKEEDGDLSLLPGASAVMFDDCYASVSFNADEWAAVEGAKDEQELRGALNQAKLEQAQQAFHVAIDRWLGSAADGFLYSVLEPHGVAWEKIRLSLDLSRLPNKDTQQRAVMLLLLTLRDFVAGRIPLGFGTNRGMGAVEVTGINANTAECEALPWLSSLAGELLSSGKLSVPADLREELKQAWQPWINRQTGGETK